MNINWLKRKFKINKRNKNKHVKMFLMIYKALKRKLLQVLKNCRIKYNNNN